MAESEVAGAVRTSSAEIKKRAKLAARRLNTPAEHLFAELKRLLGEMGVSGGAGEQSSAVDDLKNKISDAARRVGERVREKIAETTSPQQPTTRKSRKTPAFWVPRDARKATEEVRQAIERKVEKIRERAEQSSGGEGFKGKVNDVVKKVEERIRETIDATKPGYDDFLNDLGFGESSNRYDIVNRLGYMGRYQMGRAALDDAGFYDSKNRKWTELANQYGVFSDDDFLNNPKAQDDAIRAFHSRVFNRYLRSVHHFVGTTMNDILITESGLLAAAHLVGQGGIRAALNRGDLYSEWDGNGVTAARYMELYGGYNLDEIKRN